MLSSGELWQLPPTGDAAIMTNPENAELGGAKVPMALFWDCQSISWGLQRWPGSNAYVHELSQNIRSGEGKWWNEALEQARRGAVTNESYNWLHGLPSTCIREAPLQFLYHNRHTTTSPCSCPPDSNIDVCQACLDEKQGRCRVKVCRQEKGGLWMVLRMHSCLHLSAEQS